MNSRTRPLRAAVAVLDPVPGNKLPRLRSTPLEYSGDDGATWHRATLHLTKPGRYRAHATDTDGNTTELTTIAAYHLR